jgi:hypothetical protein
LYRKSRLVDGVMRWHAYLKSKAGVARYHDAPIEDTAEIIRTSIPGRRIMLCMSIVQSSWSTLALIVQYEVWLYSHVCFPKKGLH